jgi:hypothetical protein
MKLAGEFEFLGDAYPGSPDFDAAPPKGVVKLFYLAGEGVAADADGYGRCGFFKCPWWRWGAFKEAATRLIPDRAAQGTYPIAYIVAIPLPSQTNAPSKKESNGR